MRRRSSSDLAKQKFGTMPLVPLHGDSTDATMLSANQTLVRPWHRPNPRVLLHPPMSVCPPRSLVGALGVLLCAQRVCVLRSCPLPLRAPPAPLPRSVLSGAYLCLSPLFPAPPAHAKDFVHVFCKYLHAWGVFVLCVVHPGSGGEGSATASRCPPGTCPHRPAHAVPTVLCVPPQGWGPCVVLMCVAKSRDVQSRS